MKAQLSLSSAALLRCVLEVRVSSKDVPVVRQRQAFLRTDELGAERLGRICSGRSSMLGEYKTQVLGPMTIHKGACPGLSPLPTV